MLIKYPNATQLVSEPRFKLQLQSFLTPEPVFFIPAHRAEFLAPGTREQLLNVLLCLLKAI